MKRWIVYRDISFSCGILWRNILVDRPRRRRRKKFSFPAEQWKSHCWLKNWSAENPFLFVPTWFFFVRNLISTKKLSTASKFHILLNIVKIEIFQVVLHQFQKYSIQSPINIQSNGRMYTLFHIDRSPRYNPSNYKPVEENSRKPSSWPTFFPRIVVWGWETMTQRLSLTTAHVASVEVGRGRG